MKQRYYAPVSTFALAKVIHALENDDKVLNITISKEDSDLLVAFDYFPYGYKVIEKQHGDTYALEAEGLKGIGEDIKK